MDLEFIKCKTEKKELKNNPYFFVKFKRFEKVLALRTVIG